MTSIAEKMFPEIYKFGYKVQGLAPHDFEWEPAFRDFVSGNGWVYTNGQRYAKEKMHGARRGKTYFIQFNVHGDVQYAQYYGTIPVQKWNQDPFAEYSGYGISFKVYSNVISDREYTDFMPMTFTSLSKIMSVLQSPSPIAAAFALDKPTKRKSR
jgi:hypothetical protein